MQERIKEIQSFIDRERAKAVTYEERKMNLLTIKNQSREQVALYNAKFEQFQDAIDKSQTMFTQFEHEIEMIKEEVNKLQSSAQTYRTQSELKDLEVISALQARNEIKSKVDAEVARKKVLDDSCKDINFSRVGKQHRLKSLRTLLRVLDNETFLSSFAEL